MKDDFEKMKEKYGMNSKEKIRQELLTSKQELQEYEQIILNEDYEKKDGIDILFTLEDCLRILKEEGFIKDYKVVGEDAQKNILLTLKYGNKKEKVITGLKRISKPGLRVYVKSDEVPKVLNGLGIAIISTSKGIMTDKQARKENLGGEVLAYIW